MRSTYYPGVCTKPGTYYQGWFMYMRYKQGQNEEHHYPEVCTKPGTYKQAVQYVCTYCTHANLGGQA